jgi:hypothetical protein
MSTFESVPNEILHQIFKKCDQSTWKTLSITCHHFRLVVEPLRYHSMRVYEAHNAIGLLRDLIHNPRIPLCVKRLRISRGSYYDRYPENHEFLRNILPSINRYLDQKECEDHSSAEALRQKICREWDNPPSDQLKNDHQEDEIWSKQGVVTMCIILIIKSCTQVIELTSALCTELRFSELLRACPGRKLVEGIEPSPYLLPNLRRVNLNEQWYVEFLPNLCSEFAFWVSHPTIEKIQLKFEAGFEEESAVYSSLVGGRYGKSNVYSIEFIHGLRWPIIDVLLQLPRCLTELCLKDIDIPDLYTIDSPVRFSRTISNALMYLAPSLRVLIIHARCWKPSRAQISEFQLPRILPKFLRLEKLSIALEYLVGSTSPGDVSFSEYLPSSLVELGIGLTDTHYDNSLEWTTNDYVHTLIQGLNHLRMRCPNIRKVTFLRPDNKVFERVKPDIQDSEVCSILSYSDESM